MAIRLHPRARRVLDRAATRARHRAAPAVVRGLVARIGADGNVVIDIDSGRELQRQLSVDRRRAHDGGAPGETAL